MADAFQGLDDFNELVVISTANAPRNLLLSTSDANPAVVQDNRFYVWRRQPGQTTPVEAAVVPVADDPLVQELVVIESDAAPRNLLLSTSPESPVVFNRTQQRLYSWQAAVPVPGLGPVGLVGGAAALAKLAAKALRKHAEASEDQPEVAEE